MDIFATSCRICLEDGAIYPIFESDDEFESVYSKLAGCIREKLQDIEGYPRYICLKCKNTSDTICNFVAKFEKTCEILTSKIQVKSEPKEEYIDLNDNEADSEPFMYELQLFDPEQEITPKVEKRNPAEILESLSHLTVKRIRVENNLDNRETCYEDEVNVKRKKGRPQKVVTKRGRPKGSKKAVSKPHIETKVKAKQVEKAKPTETKKAVARPRAVKKERKPSEDPSKPDTETNEKSEDSRPMDLDTNKQENKEKSITRALLCDICGATYTEKKYLQIHITLKHAEKKFKCTKCPKEFLRECYLNDHKKRHDNIRTHVCDTCGKSFYDRKNLKAHIDYVHKKIRKSKTIYKCKYCDRAYTYRRGVVTHERSVHTGERPEVCKICGGSFYDIVYLREHMRLHTGDTPYKCPVCARGYAQRGNMKSHMRNHRISELDAETRAKIKPSHFKFMRPSYYLEVLKSLKQNTKEITPPKTKQEISKLCDSCGMIFDSGEQLCRHRHAAHRQKIFQCTQCPKTYSTNSKLKKHVMFRHENVRTAICDYCGKSFFTKRCVTSHIQQVHFKQRSKVVLFKCSFCEKTFKYKKGAIIHERAVHTGERPATCEVCGSSFYDEGYLKEHMRLHTGDTPYKCPVCARGYAQRGNMKSHMRNHRISELGPEMRAKIKPNYFKFMRPVINFAKKDETAKRVLCDLCGTSHTESGYYNHVQSNHTEKKFKCPKCPKKYVTRRDLNNHAKRHENIREYICDTCGKGFYNKKGLTNHIKHVHLKIIKDRRCKCRFCDKVFTVKRNALVHERSAHTGERPEKCTVCDSSFFDVVYLREHMRLHTGETPYKCPVCARGYAQRGNMKSHMRNHKISELDPETRAKIKPGHFKFMRP